MPVKIDAMKMKTAMKIWFGDADRRVAGEADDVADQDLIHQALQAADDVRPAWWATPAARPRRRAARRRWNDRRSVRMPS